MRIGLISDTHVPSMGKEPPHEVLRAFEGVELILHCGDIYIQDCITWLEQIAPVHATTSFFAGAGEGAPRASLPITLDAAGRSIGVVHKLELRALGDEVTPGMIDREMPAGASIPDDLRELFGRDVDIVVFGYTHEPMIETHQGVLFVNPGSPNMVKQSMRLGSVAILEVDGERADARILELSAFS
ncbi:MAG: YfcE family phosphodiesterase [Chloroflexota bacterium]